MLVKVAKDGKVLFTGSYGLANIEHQAPVRPQTVFKLASITKQFTAAAILLLAEDKKLKLDDKLSLYVPEFEQSEKVTLYQLLVHTSGIPDYSEDPSGSKTKSVAKTPLEMLAWISRLTPSLSFEPGSRWAYSNSNYALLGLVAERVSGQPLPALFKERLFAPAASVTLLSTIRPRSSGIEPLATSAQVARLRAFSTRTGSAQPSPDRAEA
jgi:CubicO group peptidase (beta-lactamase class C family)